MGIRRFSQKGLFFLFLPLAVFLTSCTPFTGKKFADRLVVRVEGETPIEVLEAEEKPSKGGMREISLLLRNGSNREQFLFCEVYLLTEEGLKVSVPGFEVYTCKVPAKGERKIKLVLPISKAKKGLTVIKIFQIEAQQRESNR